VAGERRGSEDVVRKVAQTLPGTRRIFLPVGLGNEMREEYGANLGLETEPKHSP
jgi:hypothetical protein